MAIDLHVGEERFAYRIDARDKIDQIEIRRLGCMAAAVKGCSHPPNLLQNTQMIEIFTVGYEGLTPRQFFDLIASSKIAMLIDVRELPLSRKKGFSKTALIGLCKRRGISYRHMSELGCPRHIRHEYRQDGDWATYTTQFKTHLSGQGKALTELAKLAADGRVCLLCFERDFNFCHRTYVAQGVRHYVPRGLRIAHLTGPSRGRVAVMGRRLAA